MNYQTTLPVCGPPSSKKFRFDSFATEFSEDNIKKESSFNIKKESSECFPDNDSGIGKFWYKFSFHFSDFYILLNESNNQLQNFVKFCPIMFLRKLFFRTGGWIQWTRYLVLSYLFREFFLGSCVNIGLYTFIT